LTPPSPAVILIAGNLGEDISMYKRLFALAVLILLASALHPAIHAQELKSGPKADEMLPGAFQALNLNGAFSGRHHCLVCENRLNPVAMVFVRAQAGGVDLEVKKLLEALDKVAEEHYFDTGLASFVVFLSPHARDGTTEGTAGDPANIIQETVDHEKLVNNLTEFAKPFKRLIVTCYPAANIAKKYSLADKAEVTVILYARHRVYRSDAFAEGQLKQDDVDNVQKGIDAMLDHLKKAPPVK
jgi:hypothetical protein